MTDSPAVENSPVIETSELDRRNELLTQAKWAILDKMMNWVHVNLALKEDIPIDELKDIYKIIKTELGEASVIRDSWRTDINRIDEVVISVFRDLPTNQEPNVEEVMTGE